MMPGLAKLMDEVAPGAVPPGLADDLWRLVYTRAHCDVDRARPYVDRDHAGLLVYARSIDAARSLLVVETGDRLVGAIGAFGPLPRTGSSVRLAASGGSSAWRLIVDEAFPLAAEVCFDRTPACEDDRRWIGRLRDALAEIRLAESVRRDGIGARRRALPALADIPACELALRERLDALRRNAFSQSDALAAFRGELPELRRRIRTLSSENDATRLELQRLEIAYGESRARTQAAFNAARWLDAFADAPFVVRGLDAVPEGLDDPARANTVLRAIALLARALPRTGARVAV
jgi:hypothetical protein